MVSQYSFTYENINSILFLNIDDVFDNDSKLLLDKIKTNDLFLILIKHLESILKKKN